MMSQTSGSNSGSTLLERNMADATKALEAASLKGRNLGEEVSRLQDVVGRKREGWKDAQGDRGRAKEALEQAKSTWARADSEVERRRGVLFSAESMLRDVKLRAVEASTDTARARSDRDEARKLVAQAVTLKLVCSAPSSDWSQSEEAEGVRERQRDLLEASLVAEVKELERMEKLMQDRGKLELFIT
jgi:hypothetical protein